MNKLPAKQIYLLSIIIIGIITLSVYSTYALFTYESSTADIVTIHTPKSLSISENVYEYQQLVIEPNTITTTDVDVYNSFEYDVCYSIWYKLVTNEKIDDSKFQIFQKSDGNLTTSGLLKPNESIRITIAIINDNDEKLKVNIGTIGAKQNNGSCSLNLDIDKKMITTSYKKLDILSEKILKEKDNVKEINENYITYKNQTNKITYKEEDKIYISENFTYTNEIFTLDNPIEVTLKDLLEKEYLGTELESKTVYFCKENSKCSILYKITELKEETENKVKTYNINVYDKLIGYSKGRNGLKQVNKKDYVFYGDNPNNYIYYNCGNNNQSTCELWRIIGLFHNEKTNKYNIKIIRNESIGKYSFEEDSEKENLLWIDSTLQKELNENYKFKKNYDTYIEKYVPNKELLLDLDNEIKIEKQDTESIVNILSLNDYINASVCKKNKLNEYNKDCLTNNWLNNIEIDKEWTLTLKEIEEISLEEENETEQEEIPVEDETQNEELTEEETTESPEDETQNEELTEEEIETQIINYVYGVSNEINPYISNELLDVRPVILLKSRMLSVSGDGSFENPYMIK